MEKKGNQNGYSSELPQNCISNHYKRYVDEKVQQSREKVSDLNSFSRYLPTTNPSLAQEPRVRTIPPSEIEEEIYPKENNVSSKKDLRALIGATDRLLRSQRSIQEAEASYRDLQQLLGNIYQNVKRSNENIQSRNHSKTKTSYQNINSPVSVSCENVNPHLRNSTSALDEEISDIRDMVAEFRPKLTSSEIRKASTEVIPRSSGSRELPLVEDSSSFGCDEYWTSLGHNDNRDDEKEQSVLLEARSRQPEQEARLLDYKRGNKEFQPARNALTSEGSQEKNDDYLPSNADSNQILNFGRYGVKPESNVVPVQKDIESCLEACHSNSKGTDHLIRGRRNEKCDQNNIHREKDRQDLKNGHGNRGENQTFARREHLTPLQTSYVTDKTRCYSHTDRHRSLLDSATKDKDYVCQTIIIQTLRKYPPHPFSYPVSIDPEKSVYLPIQISDMVSGGEGEISVDVQETPFTPRTQPQYSETHASKLESENQNNISRDYFYTTRPDVHLETPAERTRKVNRAQSVSHDWNGNRIPRMRDLTDAETYEDNQPRNNEVHINWIKETNQRDGSKNGGITGRNEVKNGFVCPSSYEIVQGNNLPHQLQRDTLGPSFSSPPKAQFCDRCCRSDESFSLPPARQFSGRQRYYKSEDSYFAYPADHLTDSVRDSGFEEELQEQISTGHTGNKGTEYGSESNSSAREDSNNLSNHYGQSERNDYLKSNKMCSSDDKESSGWSYYLSPVADGPRKKVSSATLEENISL